jgi:amino acid adenylation domain-containing protein
VDTGAQSRIERSNSALSLYHLLDPEILANPYPLFHRLRCEDPVHWDAFLHAWVVTRYTDVLEVLHTFSADRTPTPEQLTAMGLSQLNPIAQVMVKQMLFMDAPTHTRLRGLASKAFTPAKVEALKSHIQDIVNTLLDSVQRNDGMDVITELAEPLPAIVTAEMLGVPVSDRNQLKAWSANFAEMLGNFQHNPDHAETMLRTVEEMTSYFRQAIREVKAHPREGLIHALLTAEIDGDRFTEEEVLANTIVTMVGGQETTTNLIGNGLLTLLRNPDQMQMLRNDLSLIPSAVEEMLRYESPSQHTARIAPADRDMGGKLICKRDAVIAVMAAANRDPERFPDPDRFDITRKDNRHVAFGHAAHFCFGAPLARAEGQIAFETLLRRFPSIVLEPQELVWRTNLGLRGLTCLKVRFRQNGPESGPQNGRARGDESSTAVDTPAQTRKAPHVASENRQELIEKYLLSMMQGSRITSRTGSNPAPVSFQQQQIWVHCQMAPEVPVYNELVTIYRKGPLDVAVLKRCLAEIIRRHEAWRTTFDIVDGSPVQVVHAPAEVDLQVMDLRTCPKSEREGQALRLATEQIRKPFDLSRGPLVRTLLLQLDDEDFQLCVSLHHIVFDGVSIYRVLLPELVALYNSFSTGQAPKLPDLPIQYTDFATWQQQALPQTIASQMKYWRSQLSGDLPVLQLPTDRPRPAVQSFRGATQQLQLSRELSDALRSYSRREGATVFMVLLAAFATLLHRYTAQEDMIIGSVSAGRKQAELEGLLGCFQNPIALRISLAGSPTFQQLLRRVKEATVSALSNDDVPFASLVNELQPGRDLSRSPLLQVLISLAPTRAVVDPGWDLNQMTVNSGAAKFDLDLELDDRLEGIHGRLVYNTDLFDAATVARIAGHWQRLLEAVVETSDLPIGQLPILTDAEKRQLVEWNNTRTEYPRQHCIHELFEAQVERSPNAVAVVQERRSLTYAELNSRSNQLARYLRQRGVGPDVRVGISLESSPEVLIALLGVLKAGGACVPLDPKYPRERIEYMISDAQVPVLIAEEDSVASVSTQGAELISFSEDWETIAREGRHNLDHSSNSRDLAYVIYTSGSTGKPRGVLLTHAGLVNHNVASIELYGLKAEDRVLQFSSISFDIALEEIFPTLMSGATLVLKTVDLPLNAAGFLRWIQKRHITVLDLPTAYWHELAHEAADLHATLPPDLRLIIVGGEKASSAALASWRKVAGERIRWINTYGPSEASVIATAYEPGPTLPASLPIGRPIANVQVHLLDHLLQPVPVGIRGDVHIGGAGVARGYLHRPELTAQKFIPDPFCDDSSARLYKTGDLGRYLPNGEIEFLGRSDDQVKIRGFRIELGEIETCLSQYPGVAETVVVAWENNGSKSLAAYFVPERHAPTASQLRNFLKDQLPEYMVPSAFVKLESMPLNPNGKVDRRKLPVPQATDLDLEDKYVGPRDPFESRLVNIWETILSKSPVGVHDNFFELGGHSLLAVRLMHRIEQTFQKRLPISTLLHAPTVEALADVLRQESWSPSWSSLVPIQPNGSKPPMFCIHGAGGTVIVYRDLAKHLGTDQPVYGLQAQGMDGKQPILTSVEEMAIHYLKEIRRVQPEGPYFIGGLSFGGTVAYEIAQQLQARGEQIGLLFLFDTFPGKYESASELLLKLWRMPRQDQLDYVKRKIRDYKITRRFNRFFLPQTLKNVRKGIQQAGFQYVTQPYEGPVVLFRAKERSLRGVHDPYAGWKDLARGGLEVREIPGGHVSILNEPQVQVLAEYLKNCVERAPVDSSCSQAYAS